MRLRWIVIPFLLITSLGLVVYLYRVSLSEQVKRWRYLSTIEDAQVAFQEKSYEEVARLTGAALMLSSGSIEELRELFHLASSVKSSDSFPLADALFIHPEAEKEDRMAVLEFVSVIGERFYLEGLLGRLDRTELREPQVVAIRAEEMLRNGDRLGALLLLDELAAEDLELPSLRILKGRILAGERGNPLAWQECGTILGDLMVTGNQREALAAFRALVTLPDEALEKWEKPDLHDWVKDNIHAQASDYLAAAHWQLIRNPASEDEVMEEVLALADGAPEEVARWMLENGKDQLILEHELDLSSADSYPFYLARLQSFLNQQSWETAHEHLKNSHRSMKASLHAGFQAAVTRRLGDDVAYFSHLQQALEKAERSEDYGEFLSLIKIGERLDDQNMKQKACEGLVSMSARFLPRGNQLAFLEFEFGSDPEFLASAYQKLSAAKPDDPVLTYRMALIDHVILKKSAEARKALDFLLKDYPEATSLRCAKALVIAQDSLEDAFALLQNDDEQLIPLEGALESAIYQYLLRMRGEGELAQRYLRTIDWSALPPYLRSFLKMGESSTVTEP